MLVILKFGSGLKYFLENNNYILACIVPRAQFSHLGIKDYSYVTTTWRYSSTARHRSALRLHSLDGLGNLFDTNNYMQ